MNELWNEVDLGGIKVIERRKVKSRKRKPLNIEKITDTGYFIAIYWGGIALTLYGIFNLIMK